MPDLRLRSSTKDTVKILRNGNLLEQTNVNSQIKNHYIFEPTDQVTIDFQSGPTLFGIYPAPSAIFEYLPLKGSSLFSSSLKTKLCFRTQNSDHWFVRNKFYVYNRIGSKKRNSGTDYCQCSRWIHLRFIHGHGPHIWVERFVCVWFKFHKEFGCKVKPKLSLKVSYKL